MKKRGQIGTEYLIIVGFVTFAIISIFGFSLIFSNQIKDRIKMNQVEGFVEQLLSSAESVFFAGEPSKSTIKIYLPEGVNNITLTTSGVAVYLQTNNGESIRFFDSKVSLQGSISSVEGIKRIVLDAKDSYVQVTQLN